MINIIHQSSNEKRKTLLLKQLESNSVHSYRFFEAITTEETFARSCGMSHITLIKQAKENNLPYVIIAEDDLKFTDTNSYNKFLELINKASQTDCDILLSGVYVNKKIIGENKEIQVIKKYNGCHLYCIFEKAYDRCLEFEQTPIDEHIDNFYCKNLVSYVCYPFVAVQQDNIYSDNVKQIVDYSWMINIQELYVSKS